MSTAETRRFPAELVAAIDDAVTARACVGFNETAKSIYLSINDADRAELLRAELIKLFWNYTAEDGGSLIRDDQEFNIDYAPFSFVIEKPGTEDGVVFLLFKESLIKVVSDISPRVVRLGCCHTRFELYSTVVCGWDEVVDFLPQAYDAEPKRLVRDLSSSDLVPSDLSFWFLRDLNEAPFGDDGFEEWRRYAASVYLRILCTEVEPDKTLLFRGLPVLRVGYPGVTLAITPDSFRELHLLATWVYENKREAETRHGLVVAEIVRASMNASTADELTASGFRGILESARHAYQIGLHQLSKDALQALADLRKSVADETSKAADFTRQMTTSVAGALFAAVGVLAARLTLAKDVEAFSIVAATVGVILFLYVVATAKSGWCFISIQRGLRDKWRERTRKFLSIDEYSALVDRPAKQAENTYFWTAWMSILAAFFAMVTVASMSYPETFSSVLDWVLSLCVAALKMLCRTSSEVSAWWISLLAALKV